MSNRVNDAEGSSSTITVVTHVRNPGSQPLLRFEKKYHCPVERLWHAITDDGEFSSWSPWQVHIDQVVGGAFTLNFIGSSLEEGKVIEAEPLRQLAVEWDNGEILRWQLRPVDEGCFLVFTTPVQDIGPLHREKPARLARANGIAIFSY